MEYARIAARHFGTDHSSTMSRRANWLAPIPKVAAHYDQPFGNSSAVPAFICARIAREHGVTKLLAGDGGDELFGGNSRYARQKVFETWWAAARHFAARLAPLLANPLTRRLPLVRKAASYVDQASVPMPARLETYNLLKRFGPESCSRPEFLASVTSGACDATGRLYPAAFGTRSSTACLPTTGASRLRTTTCPRFGHDSTRGPRRRLSLA